LLAERDDVRGIEWTTMDLPNPEDALLADAEGRYLWVELELVGDQFLTPRLGSFRVYFPRQSYLRYLHAVDREDASSAAFLKRYLSIVESTFVDVEEQIASSSKYVDPAGIPTEHLQWLGEWLAVEADETWSADALQALIEAAPALYRKRGTAEGLLATIRLYLRHSDAGVIPRGPELVTDGTGASFSPQRDDERDQETESKAVYLIEHGDLSCIDCREVRRLYDRLISCSRGFLVLLHPDVTDAAAETIERIVEAQQPAHATGRTVHLRDTTVLNGTGKEGPGARGHHTYLGVNSRLSSREFRLGESVVGQDSRLGAREPDGQLELQSRLGEDSRLS
jgi:phage tail-like protein